MKRRLLLSAMIAALTAPLAGPALALDPDAGRRPERPPRGVDRPPRRDADRPAPRRELRGFRDDAPPAVRRGYGAEGNMGDVVEDYPRYRLRAPPRGFAWVRMGRGFALVEIESGRVYDRID